MSWNLELLAAEVKKDITRKRGNCEWLNYLGHAFNNCHSCAKKATLCCRDANEWTDVSRLSNNSLENVYSDDMSQLEFAV